MGMCVTYGCDNCSGKAKINEAPEKKITFHRFPNNTALKEKWIAAIKRENWKPSIYSKICSEHFKESDFDKSSPFRVYLKKDAIPSIFPSFPPHLQPSTSKIKPALTDDVFHGNKMDTTAGCIQLKKEESEDFDSMLVSENNTFIKQEEDENCQNTDVKIKVEPGLTDGDFQPYNYEMDSIETCNQSEGASSDVQTDAERVTSDHKHPLISIVSAYTNSLDMNGMREDCELFGEFVARELQKLKSDYSRSHLKGIIQRAILEVSEADSKI